jgi:hypothetical protein
MRHFSDSSSATLARRRVTSAVSWAFSSSAVCDSARALLAVTRASPAAVEKHVSEVLADEDWTRIDEIAEPLFDEIQRRRDLYTVQSRIFGVVPAILQALGFNAIHIYKNTTNNKTHKTTIH